MSSKTKTNKASDTRPARARYTATDQRNKNKDRRVVRDSKRKRLIPAPNTGNLTPAARKALWDLYRKIVQHAEPLTLKQAQAQREKDAMREKSRSRTEDERMQQRQRNASRHPSVIQSAR